MSYQSPKLPAATPSQTKQFTGSFMFKVFTIGGLIALLLIPLLMIDSLVDERKAREREAKDGIAMGWAPRLQLSGPMLVIPYTGQVESDEYYGGVMRKVSRKVTNYIYFFPNKLKVNADAKVSERRRGIFKANIFSSEMQIAGEFGRIDVRKYGIPDEQIQWNQAFIMMKTPNGKSVTGEPILKMNDLELRFQPRWQEKYISSYHLRADVGDARKLLIGERHPFSFDLTVRGTEELFFLPSANDFSVNITSDWSTPSFQGVSLPFEHKISKKGFSASWTDSLQDHNASIAGTTYENISMPNLSGTAFGVTFFDSVDKYQQTERTIKYGMLFILLTFLAFFLFEIKAKLQLHPFQYLLIGSANCMFYLLLLSLSEHIEFGVSYLIASASVVLLIAGYAKAILGQLLRSGVLSGVLVVFYGTMFFILIEQEFALLFGSCALFLCLVSVMYLTRNINWYKLRDTSEVVPQT
jgi:inner membrane protein